MAIKHVTIVVDGIGEQEVDDIESLLSAIHTLESTAVYITDNTLTAIGFLSQILSEPERDLLSLDIPKNLNS